MSAFEGELGDLLRNHSNDMLRWFVFDHLPDPLKAVSKKFAYLAIEVAEMQGDPREIAVALRKLLESKDAAVRSMASWL